MKRTPESGSPQIGFVFALLVALLLRIAFGAVAIRGYEPTAGDPRDYVLLAENIRAGNGYALPWSFASANGASAPLRPTALRPPLYPLFLSAVFTVAGHRMLAVVIAQALLDTLTCALVGMTGAALFGPLPGLVAVWWAALYPPLWVHVARIWSECLFVALTVMLLFTLSRQRPGSFVGVSFRAGVLVGLACLTRPNGIFLGPVALIAARGAADVRGRIVAAMLAVLGAALVLLPWTIRNYRCFGRFIPLSTMDAVVLRGAYNDEVLGDPSMRGAWSLRTVATESAGSSDEIELRDRFARSTRRWLDDHWRKLPRLVVARVARFWSPQWEASEIAFAPRMPWLESCNRLLYLLTIGCALRGVWVARRRWREWYPLLLVLVVFSLNAALTWGGWRLRAPAEPVLVLLATASFRRAPQQAAARRW